LKYIFGPVNSRRFGLSLGIDLSPEKKSCNFDCLYCEVGKGKPVQNIYNPAPPYLILREVEDFLEKEIYPEVITVTATGEPTLYPYLKELITGLNKIKHNSKTLILSNGSTIHLKDIQQTLSRFDIVKVSLDAAEQKIFQKINRPLKSIKIQSIIEGLKTFRKVYDGQLIIEILFVRNVNDSLENIKNLSDVLDKINPDRIDIGTVDRPPAYKVSPLSDAELFTIAQFFGDKKLNIITRGKDKIENKISLSKEQILNTFKRRPFTFEDINVVFDDTTRLVIKEMLEKGILQEKKINDKTFVLHEPFA